MDEHYQQESIDPRLAELLDQLRPTPERKPDVVEQYQKKFLYELDSVPLPASSTSLWERLVKAFGLWQDNHKNHNDMEEMSMLSNKHRTVLTIVAAIVLGFIIIFGGSAVTALAAQSAIPGDTLYPVKITLEQIRLSLARDAAVRAELQLEFAERRLEEAKSLIAEGRFQNIQDATLEFEIHINNALAELDIIIDGDPALAADLMKRITDTLTRYTDTLSELVNNIPEPVRTEMLHTISDVSSRVTDELILGGRSGRSGFSDTNSNDNDNFNDNENTNDNYNENTNDNDEHE
jgi:hypothetical protein